MTLTSQLSENGYSFIPNKYYQKLISRNASSNFKHNDQLRNLRQEFINLKIDSYSPGNRYRSYVQCKIDDKGQLLFGNFDPYLQTKKFNPDTGGIVRHYPIIEKRVLENPLFNMLIKSDIAFINEYEEIGLASETTIWVHLFRYKATMDAPAFSSPVWLHKDDEDVVFVHLVNSSKNMLGGESLIAADSKNIERVIKLEKVFDTLVVNHKKFHAVTPVGCRSSASESFSTRDIILVTFQKMGK